MTKQGKTKEEFHIPRAYYSINEECIMGYAEALV
jgi:hypothetical protein